LQSADVVLFDDLVLPGTLDLARREAVKLAVGKRGYKPSCTQEEISSLLVSLARDGKRVVRLKGGDPMIFGRAGEEIAALRAAHIDVEIVPGVTSASAGAAALQTSLTERGRARRLQFITAHAFNGRLPEDFDWRALADPGVTTVVYMGLKTLEPLVRKLIGEGLPADTPAALVARASWPGESRIVGTLSDLPKKVEAAGPTGPCVILIGRAVANAR
jgi:uroporphyrin-III C-methyltransferase/precorrin-2 dehydrogenase/sirohydrochlorin ferrochelatase